FSSRRRHTRSKRDWSSDVCSSDLWLGGVSAHQPVGVNLEYVASAHDGPPSASWRQSYSPLPELTSRPASAQVRARECQTHPYPCATAITPTAREAVGGESSGGAGVHWRHSPWCWSPRQQGPRPHGTFGSPSGS